MKFRTIDVRTSMLLDGSEQVVKVTHAPTGITVEGRGQSAEELKKKLMENLRVEIESLESINE